MIRAFVHEDVTYRCHVSRCIDQSRCLYTGLDLDESGYLAFSEFQKIDINQGNTMEQNARQFQALDNDKNMRVTFEEWDGDLCQMFNATNPPKKQLQMRVPFTLTMQGRPMVPGSAHWNMSAQAFKFSFSFSPQEASSLFNDSLSAQMQTSRESTGSPSQPAAIMQQLLFSIRNRRSFEPQKSMPSVDGYGILPGDEDLPPCAILRRNVADDYTTLALEAIDDWGSPVLQGEHPHKTHAFGAWLRVL